MSSNVKPIRTSAPTIAEVADRLEEHDDRLKGIETVITEWTTTANKFISALKYWGGAVLATLVAQGALNPNVAAFIKSVLAQAN